MARIVPSDPSHIVECFDSISMILLRRPSSSTCERSIFERQSSLSACRRASPAFSAVAGASSSDPVFPSPSSSSVGRVVRLSTFPISSASSRPGVMIAIGVDFA